MTIRHSGQLAAVIVLAFMAFETWSATAQERPAKPLPLFKVDDWSDSLAFAPDGQKLVIATANRACDLVLRDLAGKELSTGESEKDVPRCMHVAFSPDGKRLASVHFNDDMTRARHAICLWNVTADNKLRLSATLKKEPERSRFHYRKSLYYLTFSPNGSMLATREPDDSTVVWDTTSGKERLRLNTKGMAVAFTPDGRKLTTVTRYGLVQHWDLATKTSVNPLGNAKREDFLFVVNAIASADGKTLALWDRYSVVFKDALSGKTLRRFDNLELEHVVLSPDGKRKQYRSVRPRDREGIVSVEYGGGFTGTGVSFCYGFEISHAGNE
jgi:WD40 repeat protein